MLLERAAICVTLRGRQTERHSETDAGYSSRDLVHLPISMSLTRSKSSLRQRYRDSNDVVHQGDDITKTWIETGTCIVFPINKKLTYKQCTKSPSHQFLKRDQHLKPTVIGRESLFTNLVCTKYLHTCQIERVYLPNFDSLSSS